MINDDSGDGGSTKKQKQARGNKALPSQAKPSHAKRGEARQDKAKQSQAKPTQAKKGNKTGSLPPAPQTAQHTTSPLISVKGQEKLNLLRRG